MSRLSFLGSEFHKAFVPLFAPGTSDEAKAAAAVAVKNHLAALDKELTGRDHYASDSFSVADIYLFVMLGWPGYVGIDMSAYPALGAYAGKIAQLLLWPRRSKLRVWPESARDNSRRQLTAEYIPQLQTRSV